MEQIAQFILPYLGDRDKLNLLVTSKKIFQLMDPWVSKYTFHLLGEYLAKKLYVEGKTKINAFNCIYQLRALLEPEFYVLNFSYLQKAYIRIECQFLNNSHPDLGLDLNRCERLESLEVFISRPKINFKVRIECVYLHELKINDFRDGSIEINCPNLRKLDIRGRYIYPIDTNLFFFGKFISPKLQHVVLPNRYYGRLYEFRDCLGLRIIEFGEDFNSAVDALSTFPKLRTVIFGHHFNQDIRSLQYCPIESVQFGQNFNQPLMIWENLRYLEFGKDFNYPLNTLISSPNLEILILGSSFNHPLDPIANCRKLIKLVTGDRFDFPIDSLANCTNLSYLMIGDGFNQSIDCLKFMINLRCLKFGQCLSCDLSPISTCENLEYLHCGATSGGLFGKYPKLKSVTLSKYFNSGGNYTGLKNSVDLEGICFGYFHNSSIKFLADFKKLIRITFRDLFNCDISALSSCPKLQILVFGNRFRHSLRPLQKCRELNYLELSKNYGGGYSCLVDHCPKLKLVHLKSERGNIRPVKIEKNLIYCNVS